MTIIRQGNNYTIHFDVFSDPLLISNNVVGELSFDELKLELVSLVVSPTIGAQSNLNNKQYLFGTLLPQKHYIVSCEFKVLEESINLPVTWSIYTSSNETDLTDNNISVNLVTELNGILSSEVTINSLVYTDNCSPLTGTGAIDNPLSIDIPTTNHVFNNTVISPGTTAIAVDVSTLFSEPCADGCTPTYTLGGFSSLVYENVTLVGATLTYDVKADALSGNFPIIINRDCA